MQNNFKKSNSTFVLQSVSNGQIHFDKNQSKLISTFTHRYRIGFKLYLQLCKIKKEKNVQNEKLEICLELLMCNAHKVA